MTSEENFGQQFDMFHVSPKFNREDIEREGLKAQTVSNGEYEKGPGVWVDEEPDPDYGDDIYGIKNPPTGETIRNVFGYSRPEGKHDTERDSESTDYIPHDVPTSDFKRVGHIYRNSNGHPEIHWHPEEECPNG